MMRYRVKDEYVDFFYGDESTEEIEEIQSRGHSLDELTRLYQLWNIGACGKTLVEWLDEEFIPIVRQPKTRKVMEFNDEGRHYLVIYKYGAVNPFVLYRITYGHRKKLTEYANMQSVLWHILQDGYGVRC